MTTTDNRHGATPPRNSHGRSVASWRRGVLLLAMLAGCRGTLSPLSNKLEIGQESYFLFVADGEDGLGDLFAAAPVGAQSFQLTFTRLDERAPSLSPDGVMVAFLRSRAPGDSTAAVVIMNLVNGAERLLSDVGEVRALAWSRDGARLFLRTPSGIRAVPAPPAASAISKVEAGEHAIADSAFKILLGDPPVGEAVACEQGGICALLPSGLSVLSADGTSPARWGSDSLIYAAGNELIVRPLGGGANRMIKFTGNLRNPRGVTLFPAGGR
jgi:hypothetical protein